MLGPGERDVIAVPDAFSSWQERNRAWRERTIDLVCDREAFLAQDAFELVVAALRVVRIGADEEGGAVVDDPRRELVHFAVEGVEQDHTLHAAAEAADMQAPGGGHEAAAIGDDHHW